MKLFRGRKGPAAGVTLLLVLVLILGPLATFTTIVVKEAIEVSDAVRPWVQEQLKGPGKLEKLLERVPFAERLLPYRDELITKGGDLAGRAANMVMNTAAAGAVGTTRFILALFVMLYAMYFFLIDGRAVLEKILYYLPLTAEDEERMLDEFTSVSRATIKGTLVIGIIQGALAGTAFAVAGVKGAVFWGTVMAVLSVIPGIGSALIWVPAVIYLALTGHVGAAVGLFLWCALVVGTVDNVLRPRLVGQDTKMPDLLILISTLAA